MLRHLPKFSHNGLTVVLSKPSRFDRDELLCANGGHYFDYECLRPYTNRHCSDIRLADDRSNFITSTKAVLLLGEEAFKRYRPAEITTSLNEQRGNPFRLPTGEIAIATFEAQDSVDIKDYEGSFDDDEEDDDFGSDKGHGKTRRSNFRFWLKKDTHKLLSILQDHNCKIPSAAPPRYHIYPQLELIVELLTQTKGKSLYLDLETDEDRNVKCFGFGFDRQDIYVAPVILPDYTLAYQSRTYSLMRALAVAMRDNETVCHNGSGFDWIVLATKYRIPIRKVYDTMLAQHRCFPVVEKSLGHCMSLWTYEPYHKNEGNVGYMTMSHAMQLMEYCGKDVFGMMLVREAIDRHAAVTPGLAQSIARVNRYVKPYLLMLLQGIRFDNTKREEWSKINDRLMTQYLRCMGILMGPKQPPLISNKKCCQYFHDALGYPVLKRSEKTNNPSLDAKNLFKLRLRHDNPVIDFLIAYRETQKETGAMKFNIWKQYESQGSSRESLLESIRNTTSFMAQT